MNKTPELVDLDLPSGNLWMKMNLGATSETDYGNYYQWGSLVGYQGDEAKKHSTWDTSPFNNGKNEFDEEYFKVNRYKWIYKNNILRPEYDAVTQTYGKGFKIPTDKDFQELLDNTASISIANYKNSGKDGRLFTSKINGKTLFFPFSGSIWNNSFLGVGEWFSLWSSRFCSNHLCCSESLYCDSVRIGRYLLDDRYCGFLVRGIKVK